MLIDLKRLFASEGEVVDIDYTLAAAQSDLTGTVPDPVVDAKYLLDVISIHAPPRGATSRNDTMKRRTNFNSRPSARGDPRDIGG